MIFFFAAGFFFNRSNTDRKSTRLNSSHQIISYAVFCLKKKKPDPPAGELSHRGAEAVIRRRLAARARHGTDGSRSRLDGASDTPYSTDRRDAMKPRHRR